MLGNLLLYIGLRIAHAALSIVPTSLLYVFARGAGWCAFYAVPGARRGITSNLAVVLDDLPSSPQVRATARSVFQNDAMNWIDTLRIGSLSVDQIGQMVHVDAWETIDAALAQRRGLIMVTLHLGNYDLVGQLLAAHGFTLTVPVERMHPTQLFDFLVRERAAHGIHIVPMEHAPRSLIRALKAGEIVGLAGDRNIAGKTEVVTLFGRDAPLPVGPVSLARRFGAPLLLAVGVRLRPGHFKGIVIPIELQYTGVAAVDDLTNLSVLAKNMETLIAQYSEQWMAFQPLWTETGITNAAATISQQNQAVI